MNYNLIIRNAIAASLVYIILKLLAFVVGFDMQQWIDWVIFSIIILLFVYFGKTYANELEERERTFGTIFLHGFFASLLFIIILSAFTVLYVSQIDVDYYKKILEMAEAEMIKQNISAEQQEHFLELSKKYMTVPYLVLSIFMSNIILCNIANVISAVIFRNKNNV